MKIRHPFWTLSAASLLIGSLGFALAVHALPTSNGSGQSAGQVAQGPGQGRGDRAQRHRGPDFAAAAAQLGVTEEQLKDALGVPDEPPANGERPPRPDFAAAAQELGVTEQELMDALHAAGGGPRGRRGPDFAAAAAELGVSEQELKDALGVPAEPLANGERPPRPDFAAAAQELGVTEQQLMDALHAGHRGGGPGNGLPQPSGN